MTDPRIAELHALATSEGIRLPMPVEMILWFENRGCVVDLQTGKVTRTPIATPTPSGKAVAHLLAEHVGDLESGD